MTRTGGHQAESTGDADPGGAVPELPAGYVPVEVLADRGAVRVVRARRGERDVVCRIVAGPAGESLAELAVLASVEHPGLLHLIDYGLLPGGARYVTRAWVEGEDLASWQGRGDERALGRVLIALAEALEHLHAAGFTHADLKPSNVVVRPDGSPVLCDFGLSRGGRERGEGAAGSGSAGTLYYIAPEVLLGGEARPSADLFALGVLIHELLVGRRPSASEFYAEFPRRSFFEATGTTPADLPEWARGLVASLLARDPERRPSSAAEVARRLAVRLDLPLERTAAPPRLHWSAREAREAELATWLELLGTSPEGTAGRAPDRHWFALPEDEHPSGFFEALRLSGALEGRACTALDLDELARAATDPGALDREIVRRLAEAAPDPVLALLARRDPWSERAAEHLARAALQEEGGMVVPVLAVVAAGGPPEDGIWAVTAVPAPDADGIRALLGRELEEPDTGRVARLAEALAEVAAGSVERLDRLLGRAGECGWLVAGEERPRLRPGPPPGAVELAAALPAAAALSAHGAHSHRALLALRVAGGPLRVQRLAELVERDEAGLAADLAELRAAGLLRLEQHRDGMTAELTAAAWAPPADADLVDLRELHARYVAKSPGSSPEVLGSRLAAAPPDSPRRAEVLEELAERLEQCRDGGAPEVGLELVRRCERALGTVAEPLPATLAAERAFCWFSLGQAGQALSAVAAHEDDGRDAVRALVERVRGQVALLRHEHERALEHFDRAIELDPARRGEALVARLHALYGAGADAEVIAAVRELEADEGGSGLRPRQWAYVRSMRAMSRFRTGDADRARSELHALLEEAAAREDAGREAALAIDLATVERRTGAIDDAVSELRRAERVSEAAGHLAALAHARAALGGILRERGDMPEAELALESALGLRERLGDAAGATAVRGMLGLLLAERGHVRDAISELEDAARHLEGGQRRLWQPYLLARSEELHARLGAPRAGAGTTRAEDQEDAADPRVFLAQARARWMRGDRTGAREAAERARGLGSGLGLQPVVEESAFLVAWIDRLGGAADWRTTVEEPRAGLVRDDARILGHLLATEEAFDEQAARELARRLLAAGRDDRAARLLLALAVRTRDASRAKEHLEAAGQALARCAAGLTPEEQAALRGHLLGMPDPVPTELDRLQDAAVIEDLEMDVIKLLEINHRLVEQQDLPGLLGVIVENAIAVTGAERGFLVLEEDGELRFDTALDSSRGGVAEPDLEVSSSVVRRALAEGRTLRVSDAVEDPLLGHAPSVVELDLRSILCAPFRVSEGLRGAIYLDNRLRSGAFGERAGRLLGLLADQAALAIQQVRRVGEIHRLNRQLEQRVVQREADLETARRGLRAVGLPAPAGGLVGDSRVMQDVRDLVERAAPTDLAVLVAGESGTGKELVARALHELSPRSAGPFVTENCAALPATLIEAELFGYKRGAFTGAERDRQGMFERAHGGTIFLDEVGEMPLELQAKLLRVLETAEVRPLGDSRPRKVNFRLVTASNRTLEHEVAEGRFREDLFYRLRGLVIELPPLAARTEDIPLLVEHFLRLEEAQSGVRRELSKSVLTRLCQRAWPGNVRELRSEVARLCALSSGDVDDPELVSPAPRLPRPKGESMGIQGSTLAEIERAAILQALEENRGDKRAAARQLGISRAKVYQRLKEWAELEERP